jgi:hypothetical protein
MNVDSVTGFVLVFLVVIAILLLGDLIFAEKVARTEVIRFKGYDHGFFVVTVAEGGETTFNVNFEMYATLEVGQRVFVSYRAGKLGKYRTKIMETK